MAQNPPAAPRGFDRIGDGPEGFDRVSGTPPDPLSPSVMEGWDTKLARYSRALPAIGGALGGTLGGTAGPLGIIGGAALGGAGGEAISQLIRHVLGKDAPATPEAAATGIMEQSALQVPMELGGRALMGGARILGRGLYDAALRPTGTLLQEFPDVVHTALRERLPVGDIIPGAGQKGSQIAREARQASGKETARLLNDAGAAGIRFRIGDVIRTPLTTFAKQLDDQPAMRSDMQSLGKFVLELLEDKAGDLTPARLKAIKRSAQSAAEPVYRAVRRGNLPTAGQSLAARANSAVASGAKTSLETIPGVEASETLTHDLIGAARAIRQAEARRAPLTTHVLSSVAGAGGVGGGIATGREPKDDVTLGLTLYTLMRVAASPRTLSRAGILLNREGVQQALRALPYAAEGMYAATRPAGEQPRSTQFRHAPG